MHAARMMLGARWKADKDKEAVSSTDTNTDKYLFLPLLLPLLLPPLPIRLLPLNLPLLLLLFFSLLLGRQGQEQSHRHCGGTDGGDCVVRDVRSARGGDGEEIRLPCLFVQVDDKETGANSTARGVDPIVTYPFRGVVVTAALHFP